MPDPPKPRNTGHLLFSDPFLTTVSRKDDGQLSQTSGRAATSLGLSPHSSGMPRFSDTPSQTHIKEETAQNLAQFHPSPAQRRPASLGPTGPTGRHLTRVDMSSNSAQRTAECELVADEDLGEEPILSDLSPQFKKRMSIATREREAQQPRDAQPPTFSRPSQMPSTGMDNKAQVLSRSGTTRTASTTPNPKPSSHRGRPKGWRKGMSYSALRAGAAPGSADSLVKPIPKPNDTAVVARGVPKRRGRPPKAPSPSPRALFASLKPKFLIFSCDWQGCPAELHNLVTLRRHVHVVHCKTQSAPYHCLFAKCTPEALDEFDGIEKLIDHIEAEHIIPYAWHLGDGPKVSPLFRPLTPNVADKLPDYLFDNNGNQVTQSVKDQDIETFVEWRARRRKLKEALRRMNDTLPGLDSSDGSADT